MEGLPERDRAAEEEALGQRLGEPEPETVLETEGERRAEADLPPVLDTEGLAVALRELSRPVGEAVPPPKLLLAQRLALALGETLRGAEME
jgi:hypothetical protein